MIHNLRATQLLKFSVVGGAGFIVDMTLLYFLTDPARLALNVVFSKIIAAVTAMANNFIWNELWTFRQNYTHANPRAGILRRFVIFCGICSIGIALAVLLLHAFHTVMGWNVYISNILAILIVTGWNFGLNSVFNWGRTVKHAKLTPCITEDRIRPTMHRLTLALGVFTGLAAFDGRCAESAAPGKQVEVLPSGDASRAEQLKTFIASPPNISEMIAEVCIRNPEVGGLNCYFALLRYQTNAFFYREAPTLLDLETSNTFAGLRLAGYYDSYHWNFAQDGRGLFVERMGNQDSREQSLTNQISLPQTLKYLMRKASPLLHLGIDSALPGTVHWDGDMIRPFTNYAGVKMQGHLDRDELALPRGLNLFLMGEKRVVPIPWVVSYEYQASSTRPQFFPEFLRSAAISGSITTVIAEIRFLRVDLGSGPLPMDYFTPAKYLNAPLHRMSEIPSGFYYFNELDGRWKPGKLSNSGPRRLRVAFYVVISLIGLAALFFLSWTGRNSEKVRLKGKENASQ